MWGYVMSFVMIKCFNNIGWRDHSSQQQWAAQKELILTTPVLISPRQSPAPAGCCRTATHKLLPALQFKHFYHRDFLFD